jgi:hypothetical protein
LLERVTVNDTGVIAFQHGNPVKGDFSHSSEPVRVYNEAELFLGVGFIDEQNLLAPKRVVNYCLDDLNISA